MAERKRRRKHEHVLIDCFTHIPKYLLTDDELQDVKEMCTIEYMDGFPPKPRINRIYEMNGSFITVPRSLGEELCLAHGDQWPVLRRCIDTVKTLPEGCKPNFDLYPHQEEASTKMLESCERIGGCLLQGHCSFGKTRTAMVTAQRLGYRTLIIVHTDVLAQQWVDDILANMETAHVLMKPNKAISQQKKRKNGGDIPGLFAKWESVTHIVVTVHSLAKEPGKLDPDFAQLLLTCGTVIADEAHLIPSRFFRLCANALHMKYRIALTATPVRDDNFHLWIYASFGPVVYQSDPKEFHDGGLLKVVYIPNDSIPQETNSHQIDMDTEGFVDEGNSTAHVTRVKNMVCHPIWISTVINVVKDIMRETPDRCILVISLFVDQCVILDEKLQEAGFTVNALYDDKRTATRETVRPGTILISTFHQGGTGNDFKTDTLVFASSRGKIDQTIGRVMRVPDRMLIVDIVYRSLRAFQTQFRKRKLSYEYYGFYQERQLAEIKAKAAQAQAQSAVTTTSSSS